jgi:hypothetical protein
MRSGIPCFVLVFVALGVLPGRAAIITIDNQNSANAPGNTFSIMSGAWSNFNDPQSFGGISFYHAPGTGANVVRWQPSLPVAGSYDVLVWYGAAANYASNAPYTIDYNGGSLTVPVNQHVNGSMWVDIGTYPFVAGTAGDVRLSDAANGYVIADAVQFSSVPEPAGISVGAVAFILALRRRSRHRTPIRAC